MSTMFNLFAHSFILYILFFISYFLFILFYVYFPCVVFYNNNNNNNKVQRFLYSKIEKEKNNNTQNLVS